LRDLRTAAPDLNRLLARLGPFSQAARPAFRALGRTSVSGVAALRETRQEVAALQKLSRDVPGVAKPLRQFLQTMDDAKRSIERDPRAARSAPPAPDKTADRTSAGRNGFTGFEAFWDYAYWQALAINGRDSKSHILRINAFPDRCSDYRATDQGAADVFQECKQNLGPSQPGIGGQPDPTAGGASASRNDKPTPSERTANRHARAAKRERVADKGGSKPAAAPTTPDAVEKRSAGVLDDLLGGVLGGKGDKAPAKPDSTQRSNQPRSPANEEMLLDYLLKP
jgi:hypothetical protein